MLPGGSGFPPSLYEETAGQAPARFLAPAGSASASCSAIFTPTDQRSRRPLHSLRPLPERCAAAALGTPARAVSLSRRSPRATGRAVTASPSH